MSLLTLHHDQPASTRHPLHAPQEIQNSYHTNALLVKILLSQAQALGMELFVDTNQLENEFLLKQVGCAARRTPRAAMHPTHCTSFGVQSHVTGHTQLGMAWHGMACAELHSPNRTLSTAQDPAIERTQPAQTPVWARSHAHRSSWHVHHSHR